LPVAAAELFLVRPMLAVTDTVTLFSAISFVLFAVYSVALWTYGFIRTGLLAFPILIIAAVIGIAVSIANVALVYDSYIGIRLLGQSAWKIFYYAFVCIQPIQTLLSAVALTMLVIWITRDRLTNR
jgi:hypothetical protein